MTDKLFISETEIIAIKDVSVNLDQAAFDQAITESQLVDLIPVIGDELYLILQGDFDDDDDTFGTTKYDELFNGKDYTYQGKTIRYRGLSPALAYYAYARLLNNAQMSVTRMGAVTFTNDPEVSEAAVQAQIRTKVTEARGMAKRYEEDAVKFLDANRASYPEWVDKSDSNRPFNFIKL